ncbi:hypothetical protein JF50_02325 [Pseudoalteromonas luteoviolacea]|uniref:Phytanoyl-CoA dioxygenase family protein n=1 Tax=Pseudoalteromonas luteoviolacea TaxID=43657 RepID=A0A0C1QH95_9GAMM|nr:hypothetical protein [Pseudoalteromonas luteoviolacea]KID58725.1 hypothetical protein JF50_02325 [Pseudoalteromonas luteoviolacea]
MKLDKRELSLQTMYLKHGLLPFQNMYPQQIIDKWNGLLDPIFHDRQSPETRYVYSNELVELGILDEVLNNKLLSAITVLDPCPILFQCHCFEIDWSRAVNQTHCDLLEGWHKDHRDPNIKSVYGCRPFSIYIYLNDVKQTNEGAFEIIPGYATGSLESNLNYCNLKGRKGTCFLWNRDLYHRLHEKNGSTKQRILKLSVQTNGWAHSKARLDEFHQTRALLNNANPALSYLFGSHCNNNLAIQTIPFARKGQLPQIRPIDYSRKTHMPSRASVMFRRFKSKVDQALGF